MNTWTPSPAAIEWLADHNAGRVIADIGAGDYLASDLIDRRGLRLLAIEPNPPEGKPRPYLAPHTFDRVTYLKTNPVLAVVAYPDGSWWRALPSYLYRGSAVLYVGPRKGSPTSRGWRRVSDWPDSDECVKIFEV